MKSPCVKVCKLQEQGMCVGCGRMQHEIEDWAIYTDERREKIMQYAQVRLDVVNRNAFYQRFYERHNADYGQGKTEEVLRVANLQ